MSTIVSVPLANQLQVPFLKRRSIYEIRERHSRMYRWTALITSLTLVELPWNILGSSLYFLCWYWTVGFPSSRAGFTYFMLSFWFPIYYTTIGLVRALSDRNGQHGTLMIAAQAVAAMAPNAEIAAILFSFLFSFVLTLYVPLARSYSWITADHERVIATVCCSHTGCWAGGSGCIAFRHTPISSKLFSAKVRSSLTFRGPLSDVYFTALGRSSIQCSDVELATIEPPSGQSCSQYLNPFVSANGGYLTNGDATSGCKYCPYSTTDAFLSSSFNIFYSHHWRNVGIFAAFVVFNVSTVLTVPSEDATYHGPSQVFAIYAFTWLFRMRQPGRVRGFVRRLLPRRSH